MDRVIRQFAQRVVAVHAALFLLLLVIVGFASREIYQSARQQSLEQAGESQALIAAQTARGIESFYNTVLSGLDLVRAAEDEMGADAATTTRPAATDPHAFEFARLVSRRLEDRVSQVFIVDRNAKAAHPLGETDRALPPGDVVGQLGDWFAGIKGAQISPIRVHAGTGYNVAAVPTKKTPHLVIAATVPVRAMEARLLDRLGVDQTVAGLLADESDIVMAAREKSWVGRDLTSLGGPLAGRTLDEMRGENFRGTHVIPEPFRVGDDVVPAAIFATEPVLVSGKRWFLLIASDLTQVDAAVTGLVRRGLVWVIFVTLSMTALLVSTSVQLIRNRVRMERERSRALETELEHARQIQLAWLPGPDATSGRIDVAAVNNPASHISGDFYNWFDLPDGRTAVVIGDVTGHGMSAAFLMATVQLLVRNTLPQTLDPGRCLEDVNNQLCVQMFHGQFVTMSVLVIDSRTGAVSMATAGHPPPLANDGDASFAPLKLEPQLVLGIQPGVDYPTERVSLAPGSSLLLYTDGVPDAVSADGKRFDTDRLRESIDGRYDNAAALLQAVIASLDTFRAGRELVDDLTLVAVQLRPAPAPRADDGGAGAVETEAAAI